MEDDNFEWNNMCSETNELYADKLSGDENDTDKSDDSDFPINIKRKALPIVSDSETNDSDGTDFENEESSSTTHWSRNDVVSAIMSSATFAVYQEEIFEIYNKAAIDAMKKAAKEEPELAVSYWVRREYDSRVLRRNTNHIRMSYTKNNEVNLSPELYPKLCDLTNAHSTQQSRPNENVTEQSKSAITLSEHQFENVNGGKQSRFGRSIKPPERLDL
ncbi:hypothetical protein FQA39_LY03933 [Lamprigera yunnana]|nr:hypothetical protein FQA39_LY03933 [Lamprigera yunnana]